MRVVIQRVSKAEVKTGEEICGKIDAGLLVLLAVRESDNDEIMHWMANKIVNLRIFQDEDGRMNRSVLDINGGILLISNFTLYGDAKKGFRPSFGKAAPPEIAAPLYHKMIEYMKEKYTVKIESGIFGAMMDIEFVNSGPVTIIIEKEAG